MITPFTQQIMDSGDLFKEGVGSDILGARNFIGEVIEVLEEILELTNIDPITMSWSPALCRI
jgi:hypothetical protein